MSLVGGIGLLLVLLGLWGMLTQKNLIKMIIGFSIVDTGSHLVIVSLGYIRGNTAPILNDAVPQAEAAARVVDPLPSALVLTAIVIGLAVTALMLTYAVQLHRQRQSLMIDDYKELKW
jgi:multicomponent Na+:H+ antiporter subunit C